MPTPKPDIKESYYVVMQNLKQGTVDESTITHLKDLWTAVNSYDEMKAFIHACLDCKSADELMDLVQNNAEDQL